MVNSLFQLHQAVTKVTITQIRTTVKSASSSIVTESNLHGNANLLENLEKQAVPNVKKKRKKKTSQELSFEWPHFETPKVESP